MVEQGNFFSRQTSQETLGLGDTFDDTQGRDDTPFRSSQRRFKLQALSDLLNDEQEDALVEWFENLPLFYNKTAKDYKNIQLKERIITEKAAELTETLGRDITVGQMRAWIKGHRTNYGKLVNRPSGSAAFTERQEWTINRFQFLRPHIKRRTERLELGMVIIFLNYSIILYIGDSV